MCTYKCVYFRGGSCHHLQGAKPLDDGFDITMDYLVASLLALVHFLLTLHS